MLRVKKGNFLIVIKDGYVTTFGHSFYCIPYEGNEHLFTTKDDCSDFYKTWEEK